MNSRVTQNGFSLIELIVVIVLLATSSDAAIRRLGPRRWKALQRTAYGAMALVVAHCILYQQMIQREATTLTVFWLLTGGLVLVRLSALAGRRNR